LQDLTPTAEMMLLHGHDITGDPPNKRSINTVFQSYDLFPHLSVSRAFGSASASPYLANETTNAVNPVIKKEASKMDLHGQIFDAVKTRADTGGGEVS
jgi:ABC-type Fe3+/spermidine/putrescine transport system ATPase subunit